MQFDMNLISQLVEALLKAILPVLASMLSAYLYKLYQAKRLEMDEKQRWIVDGIVSTAIVAAEQLYKAGNGAEKKAYALKVATEYLASKKITINLTALEALIEAAVYGEFTVRKQIPEG